MSQLAGPSWAWPGDIDSARAVGQAISTSVMAATALTFSLTVVGVQLASQQFSPRLLREFARDRVTKAVLSVLATTFVFALTVLSVLDPEDALPRWALLVSVVLGLASFASMLVFIGHVVRQLRVDTMMISVHRETSDAIRTFYPPRDNHVPDGSELGLADAAGQLVLSTDSGFVQRIWVDDLVEAAHSAGAIVRIEVRTGDHVVDGAPIATVWRDGEVEGRRLLDAVRDSLELGYERTIHQDVAFGFRQLEDIAVKAMSPSINDPVTAAHAVGHMADLLVLLVGRRLGATAHADGDGCARAIVPDRDLWYYLELCSGELRRVAGSEPTVLAALLRMLRDVAAACRTSGDRANVAEAARRVEAAVDPDVRPHDRARVDDLARRVQLALDGDLAGAYHDRTGETRST